VNNFVCICCYCFWCCSRNLFIFILTRPTYGWIIPNAFMYIVHVCKGTFLPSPSHLPTLPRVCGKSKIAIESDRMIYFHCGNRVSRRHRVFLVDNSQNAQNLSRLADDWSPVYTFTYVHIRETRRGICESIIAGCPKSMPNTI